MTAVMDVYRAKLAEFEQLKPDWDSYGAVPGDMLTLDAARVFLEAIINGDASLVPTVNGGVQIEVHTGGFEIDVEFETTIDEEIPTMRDIVGIWEPV